MPKYKIGEVLVDSGQLIIVDPAYLKYWKANDDYPAVSQVTTRKDIPAGECFPKGLGKRNLAIASTTEGDGKFPVYVNVNDAGYVTSIVIDLEH